MPPASLSIQKDAWLWTWWEINTENAFSWKLTRRLQSSELKSELLFTVIDTEFSYPFDPANMLRLDLFFFSYNIFFFWDEFFVSPFSCHFERNNLELPTVIMLYFVSQLTCEGHTSESCDSACPVWSACFKLLSVALPCLWCCICWFFQTLFFGATEVRKYRR